MVLTEVTTEMLLLQRDLVSIQRFRVRHGAKLRDWASVAVRGWLLLSRSIVHASLETAVFIN